MRIGGAILIGNTCSTVILSNMQKLRTVLSATQTPYVTFQGQGVTFGGTIVSWQGNIYI